MHCRWYSSMPCSRSPGGVWYPSMPCRFPGPHPRGKFQWDLARGVSRPTHKGEVEGIWPGGTCSRGVSAPGGCLLQGGCVCSRGQCLLWGVWRTPPTATAAGDMHPTGMHSCFLFPINVFVLSISGYGQNLHAKLFCYYFSSFD